MKLHFLTNIVSLVTCETNLMGVDYDGRLSSAYVNPSNGWHISPRVMKAMLNAGWEKYCKRVYKQTNCLLSKINFEKIFTTNFHLELTTK